MKKSPLLETSQWRDIVELGLCMEIYNICNDNQFDFCTPLDFANFMNLRDLPFNIAVKPKEKLRVCYMIQAVADKISPRKEGIKWSLLFLKRCGIGETYYKSHKTDIRSRNTSEDNQEYKELIDRAICNWHKRNIFPT